jgi:hypothetical protein
MEKIGKKHKGRDGVGSVEVESSFFQGEGAIQRRANSRRMVVVSTRYSFFGSFLYNLFWITWSGC